MIIVQYSGSDSERLEMSEAVQSDVRLAVSEIIRSVRERGDTAVREYTAKFDGFSPDRLEVTAEETAAAFDSVPADLLAALRRACRNIREFHSRQIREGFSFVNPDGITVGQKITPIEKVGLYIPGGTARYPSSVLMNAIPASIAGCSEIIMVSPPSESGEIPPVILAAAKLAGVHRIFRVGGAQAVAALAYGTESIPKVDKIVGPGNAYVAEAKRQVFGAVSIDMIAGPSEILIIADSESDPRFIAADLLSQAEHDRRASAVLITDSYPLAEAVSAEVERRLSVLPREGIARESIESNGRIIVVPDMDTAFEAANKLAPEHLELCLDGAEKYLGRVSNAGSVFLGRYCPESLGDYLAGPNHTLPTSGTARFSSPLSVDDFIKKTQYICCSGDNLSGVGGDIALMARSEGLEAHARAALIRTGDIQ